MNSSQKRTIVLLSFGHLVLDSYSSFLVPILPLLSLKLGLTPAQAGWLIPIMMVSSSLMQPVYGIISDRYFKRALAVFGPLVAAVFISSIGLANSVPMLIVIVTLGGIGIGAFHPQAAALSHRAVSTWMPERQGTVMSVFSSSGTVGYALGPLIISSAVAWFGLEHSYYTMGFGIIASILLWLYCPVQEMEPRKHDAPRLGALLKAARVPLTILYFAVVLRSATSVSIQSYLPFLLKEHGLTLQQSSLIITGFIFFGGIGGFFGGAMADRFGARRISMVAVILACPLLILGLLTPGGLGYGLILLGGTALNLPLPIAVVMAQRLVPGGASTVSALVMGFAWGLGAMMTPITGKLTESVGLTNALIIVAVFPVISAVLFWRYPKDHLPRREQKDIRRDEALVGAD